MKYFIILIMIIVLTISAYSEDKKDSVDTQSAGVSVGMAFKPSYFKNGFALLTGAKLGLTYNKNYYAGLALYGLTFQQYKPDVIDEPDTTVIYPNLELSYYGLELEYNLNPESILSPSFMLFSGFYINSFNIPNTVVKSSNYNPDYKESNNSFLLEPSVNLNFHLKSFYVFTVGISYRYFFGVEKSYKTLTRSDKSKFVMDNTELNSLSVNVYIRFGSF